MAPLVARGAFDAIVVGVGLVPNDELAREVEALASGGESDIIEFKRSTGQRSDAMRTICGMLNGRGGYVLFGVTDAGVIEGQEVSTRTMEDIAHELRKIDPQPALTPERVVLARGLPFFVEKPLALDAADVDRIAATLPRRRAEPIRGQADRR